MSLLIAVPAVRADNWPAWRGPRLDGVPTEKGPFPLKWSEKDNIVWVPTDKLPFPIPWVEKKNILWKSAIPGKGHSSPVIWSDRIFLTSCDEATGERFLICINRADGKIVWQETVFTGPLEKKHNLNSSASSTPVTDGKHVW